MTSSGRYRIRFALLDAFGSLSVRILVGSAVWHEIVPFCPQSARHRQDDILYLTLSDDQSPIKKDMKGASALEWRHFIRALLSVAPNPVSEELKPEDTSSALSFSTRINVMLA